MSQNNKASPGARILHIAIPTPLLTNFDYLATRETREKLRAGIRVRVPFGRKEVVGILLEERCHTDVDPAKLKEIISIIDSQPVLNQDLMQLAHWAKQYYHHPMGLIFSTMLPGLLRRGEAETLLTEKIWSTTAAGQAIGLEELSAAPKQQVLLKHLRAHPPGQSQTQLLELFKQWRTPMEALKSKGLVTYSHEAIGNQNRYNTEKQPLALNADQQNAFDHIAAGAGSFNVWLLEGITGSGKTEVYLHLIDRLLQQQQQVLILVPEIGLTPQLLQRFESRFNAEIVAIHSNLSDRQRLSAWTAAKTHHAQIIIGTRSAVFIPLSAPGLIIVDEEHDNSFKQQDGFRYSARDLAIVRARQLNIPIILGSATPSLETLHNARMQRYQHLQLPQRAGKAKLPRLSVVDARQTPARQPLTRQLIERMHAHLQLGKQVLIFLNRRGFAPVLSCEQCGWMAQCSRCDAYLTLHKHEHRLRCHHCGYERKPDRQCPDCGHSELHKLGRGTEQIEAFVKDTFPNYGAVRIDRDATRHKGSLEKHLEKIQTGATRILIGTQMLSKGHHFPEVTLVGILDIDQGLFSADFRGPEYMAQLITQVAGRAGRGESPGEVLIETRQPEHPLLHLLIQKGYAAFADAVLKERQAAQLPPFSKLALIRAEAVAPQHALDFLQATANTFMPSRPEGLEILGPIPAPMERRAGRYRAQLLLQTTQRRLLHQAISSIQLIAAQQPLTRRVRWSIDIDPTEML